ncbi:MAG TPA: PLP-dependent aminotransferase family protein [Anaerolineales bacterium]|nr:PLP-dependent aminotransferase family protein [Anaerolineales bacterium]
MTSATQNLASEVADLKRSVMRELLGLAVDPQIISLAGGLPASSLLPLDDMRRCLDDVLLEDGARALQYSPPYEPLRQWIAQWMQRRGVICTPDDVFLTGGAQQGLAILSRLFLDRGDAAVVESVTFTGIQQVTAGRGADVRAIPTDLSTGADMDALEDALRRTPRPRLVVLIPDFHNPLGVSLTEEKRRRAAALAAAYGVPLVEDDPYSALRFEGESLAPIKAHDQTGLVFYLGSFSKMIAPALRLGWIVAPAALSERITVLRESLDLESSSLIQRAVYRFVSRGLLEPHLEQLNRANLARRDVLLAELEKHFGGQAHWTNPAGGLFVWLTLPPEIDTWDRFRSALARKVAYIPGSAFAVDGGARNALRLNFSNVPPERIPEAVARLAQALRPA